MKHYKQHPLGKIPPAHSEKVLAALRAELAEGWHADHGEIWLYENKILDGWGRYTVCRELGVEIPDADFVEFDDSLEPARDFVRRQSVRAERPVDGEWLGLLAALKATSPEARKAATAKMTEAAPKAHKEGGPAVGPPSKRNESQRSKERARKEVGASKGATERGIKLINALGKENRHVAEQAADNKISIDEAWAQVPPEKRPKDKANGTAPTPKPFDVGATTKHFMQLAGSWLDAWNASGRPDAARLIGMLRQTADLFSKLPERINVR